MTDQEAKNWVLSHGFVCKPHYHPQAGAMGQCMRCFKDGTWQRQKTAYTEEPRNWACYCAECQKDEDLYWDERWQEYYSGLL